MSEAKAKSIHESHGATEQSSPLRRLRQNHAGSTPNNFDSGTVPQIAGNLAVQRVLRPGNNPENLTIGAPDEPCEREADRISDQMIGKSQRSPSNTSPGSSHGQCSACGGENKLHPNHKDATGPTPLVTPPIVRAALSSPGQPLDKATRQFFEPLFHYDFGNVRVHTNSDSADSAKAIHANAYTIGNDIVFGDRRFNPMTDDGRKLIGHELSHVVQQSPATVVRREPSDDTTPSEAYDRVHNAFGRLTLRLASANQRDATVVRQQWLDQISEQWSRIGAPGELSDAQLQPLYNYAQSFEKFVQAETERAQQHWRELQIQYQKEMDRLAGDPDVGPKARGFLDQRYKDTVEKVNRAGDVLVEEDLVGLQNMLSYGTHVQWVREGRAREEEEERRVAERKHRYKLQLYELSELELNSQISSLLVAISTLDPTSPESTSMQSYLSLLQNELSQRQGRPYAGDAGAYPHDVARFSSFLIRGGYLQDLAKLLPPEWAKLSDAELTAYLSKRFSEAELKTMFLAKYSERVEIKMRFRKLNIIAALVTGLIWARENISEGDWSGAVAKVGGSGIGAFVFNKLLYERDPTAASLMARKAGEYGRWFAGAARSNRFVNFLARRVAPALVIWDLKDIFMSGGYEGPNIPFDIIETIDINDPSTWTEPSQTLLDFGFNIWYRQACTPAMPEACGPDMYLGKVEGSVIGGIASALGLTAHSVDRLKHRLYRIEGDFDVTDLLIVSIVHRSVSADENILVVSTGMLSGERMSGRGHYRSQEVIPANEAAVELFGGPEPRHVPEYLLEPVDEDYEFPF